MVVLSKSLARAALNAWSCIQGIPPLSRIAKIKAYGRIPPLNFCVSPCYTAFTCMMLRTPALVERRQSPVDPSGPAVAQCPWVCKACLSPMWRGLDFATGLIFLCSSACKLHRLTSARNKIWLTADQSVKEHRLRTSRIKNTHAPQKAKPTSKNYGLWPGRPFPLIEEGSHEMRTQMLYSE